MNYLIIKALYAIIWLLSHNIRDNAMIIWPYAGNWEKKVQILRYNYEMEHKNYDIKSNCVFKSHIYYIEYDFYVIIMTMS